MNSLPLYASMLCNQVGLKFTMGGDTAWSAGGHVNVPALPYNDPSSQRLAYGMIMHEGGHESHTDYQAWDAIEDESATKKMVNRLEDIRIEKKQIDRYPGAKAKLQDMVAGLCSIGYWSAPSANDSPTTLLGKAILYRLRASVLSQDALAAWGSQAQTLLEEAIPKHLAMHLTTIAAQVVWCKNTAEVVELAANILDLLKQEKDKLEEEAKADPQQSKAQSGQQQGQQGQGQGNSQDPSQNQRNPSQGNSPGQGAGNPQQGHDPAAGQGQGHGGKSDPGKQTGASTAPQGGGSTSGVGDPANGDPSGNTGSGASGDPQGDPQAQAKAIARAQAQALGQILKGENDEAPGDVGTSVCQALTSIGGEQHGGNIAMPEASKATLEAGETTEILARVRNASRALQTRAYRIFEATANRKRKFKEDGRRVDVTRLWRPKSGDYRVFVEKEEAVRVNTAVQLLVDISYSMTRHDRLLPAIDSALALALALSKLNGVKVATATFPAVGASGTSDEERVSYIHTFDQRPEAHAKRYAAMSAHSWTPTAEALLWAGREILARKETRKIVFVLTDGMPEMPERNLAAYRRLTVEVRKSLEAEGVEVIGVGIGIDVLDVFPTSVVVNNLEELAGGVFALMSKTLFKKAA